LKETDCKKGIGKIVGVNSTTYGSIWQPGDLNNPRPMAFRPCFTTSLAQQNSI